MSIKYHRIEAMVIKNIYNELGNIIRLADSLYWPIIDITLWGLTSVWMQKSNSGVPNVVLVVMTGLVLWQVINRANQEISLTLIEEIWSKSLVNLFSTPLQLSEWILGSLITGLIKTICVLFFGGLIVWLFYALNIFQIGWVMLPFTFSLILFGWVIGFFGSSFIIYYGQKVQSIPWIMLFLFAPFSAVFYPVKILPYWMQLISYALPGAYIFEGMREALLCNVFPFKKLLISFALNAFYLTLSLSFFKFMFEKSREKGLSQL